MSFPRYSFARICSIADEVRNKYSKKPESIPVDVDSIIEFGLGLEVIPIPNLKSEADTEGMLSNDLKSILIDNNLYSEARFESRARFTLAHELGHFTLHKEFYSAIKFQSAREWREHIESIDETDLHWFEIHANEFAGRLLVPIEPLKREVDLIKSEIKAFIQSASKKESLDGEELQLWINSAVAKKIAGKFFVSPQVIETRLKREKIDVLGQRT